ncbi:hypothetical protein ACFE04_029032 [Oxalis oulophora]
MRAKKAKASVDRISELPDDIIANIISRLSLKRAATTSLISTKWKDLWKLYSGSFDFDGSKTIRNMRTRYKVRKKKPTKRTLRTKRMNFVNWVNKVLRSHQGATMERLQIIFDLKKPSHQDIDRWIQFALVKRVHSIELDLTSFISYLKASTSYAFPIRSHCGFESLRTLVLKHVDISGDALHTLVGNCPNLEELEVTYAVSLKVLELSSLTLKSLSLFPCVHSDNNPMDIKVSAPNLSSFAWTGIKVSKLVLENVPKLKNVEIHGYWNHIRSYHSQIDQLDLSIVYWTPLGCENQGNTDIPELSCLKDLTMKHHTLNDDTLRLLVAYLKAAPLLEKFALELSYSACDVNLSEALLTNTHCYSNLKTMQFFGFGSKNDVEFIRYLLDRAPLLEAIILSVCPADLLGTHQEIEYKKTAKYLEDRETAISFCESLSSDVTVII